MEGVEGDVTDALTREMPTQREAPRHDFVGFLLPREEIVSIVEPQIPEAGGGCSTADVVVFCPIFVFWRESAVRRVTRYAGLVFFLKRGCWRGGAVGPGPWEGEKVGGGCFWWEGFV